jgi:periplasmic divalent cation tolerance protein
MRIVISTCKPEEAENIADTLLKEGLIASCNIVPGITTKVRFKGEALTQSECLLIMRTREDLLWKLERRYLDLNSFEIPEITSIEAREWNVKFYNWIQEATKNG